MEGGAGVSWSNLRLFEGFIKYVNSVDESMLRRALSGPPHGQLQYRTYGSNDGSSEAPIRVSES